MIKGNIGYTGIFEHWDTIRGLGISYPNNGESNGKGK